jgi:hypothetical protein
MPYRLPRQRSQQAAYNRHLQDQFDATRRVPASPPAPESGVVAGLPPGGPGSAATEDLAARLKDLAQMHHDGALSDEEFATAKARILGPAPAAP